MSKDIKQLSTNMAEVTRSNATSSIVTAANNIGQTSTTSDQHQQPQRQTAASHSHPDINSSNTKASNQRQLPQEQPAALQSHPDKNNSSTKASNQRQQPQDQPAESQSHPDVNSCNTKAINQIQQQQHATTKPSNKVAKTSGHLANPSDDNVQHNIFDKCTICETSDNIEKKYYHGKYILCEPCKRFYRKYRDKPLSSLKCKKDKRCSKNQLRTCSYCRLNSFIQRNMITVNTDFDEQHVHLICHSDIRTHYIVRLKSRALDQKTIMKVGRTRK